MGIPTVCAMVSAFAPGYTAVTCTVGGVMDGYWSMGSTKSATPPATNSNSDSTVANIGRSMKNLENFMVPLFLVHNRVYWHSVAHLEQCFGHIAVIRGDSVSN